MKFVKMNFFDGGPLKLTAYEFISPNLPRTLLIRDSSAEIRFYFEKCINCFSLYCVSCSVLFV